METVFVTGLPRSGSTWVCQGIAAAIKGRIVHEPFNWRRYPDRIGYHMKYYRSEESDDELITILKKSMEPRFPFQAQLSGKKNLVVKDVHVCLAVEPIWNRFQPHMIFLIRHPCAMVQSWARLDYEVNFRVRLLLSQDKLVEDHLAPFKNHLVSSDNYFFNIGAYWGASYFIMHRLSQSHKEWQWVTHEALCLNSTQRYESLLKKTGIIMDVSQRHSLEKFIDRNNRKRRKNEGDYSVARLSASEPNKWKAKLSPEEQQMVLEGAKPFGLLETFYPVETSVTNKIAI